MSMGLPGSVARYGDVVLPDFDQLVLYHSVPPTGATLRAWSKLQTAERGLNLFDWVVHVVREPSRCVTLVDYTASSFILALEATLQALFEERKASLPDFRGWLGARPNYGLELRGLRTLRHLEAHVRAGSLSALRDRSGHSRFAAGVDPGRTVAWLLPQISEKDWDLLKGIRPLERTQLADWNALVSETLAADVMREGLQDVAAIVRAGEALPR
jgi:hypothetical protein